MEYLILVLGFVLLVKGADYFVDGASALSKKLGIPSIIIGLTVVAFGTSMPEAAVSVTASLAGKSDLSMGNIIGSNLFNLLLVLGFSSIFSPVQVNKSIIKKDFPFSIIITVALMFLTFNIFVSPVADLTLTRADGVVLLVLFAIFMYYTISSAKIGESTEEYKDMPLWKQLLLIIGGVAGICLGGKFVVDSASEIATNFGLSEGFIGLTIAAVGTSLPELVTSIVASRKGENDIALGNVIGSNIFNILFILGIASTINSISVSIESLYDILILTIVSITIYIVSLRKKQISRPVGICMVATYIIYLTYISMR